MDGRELFDKYYAELSTFGLWRENIIKGDNSKDILSLINEPNDILCTLLEICCKQQQEIERLKDGRCRCHPDD